ncbi:homoserine dehydrogenase [Enterococcus sp. 2201sp1_2201st1_B8_2201SCRN_220225]|uniref:homoserine dehydrogenase n=1 Tax=unclassified Enterococcus TaxID=2608891 RepID=UPI0034A124C6
MQKRLQIGILGLGVVGCGVVQILSQERQKIKEKTGVELVITKALVRPGEDKSALATAHNFQLVYDINDITADSDIDVVVEVMGKIHPANEFVTEALQKGKHVVTANKDLLAEKGTALVQTAIENHVSLYYEASVAGGIPILRVLANSFVADEITEVLGIINGTTNYMLTQMVEEGMSYEDALVKAQELGFAESDPKNDVDGIDAAYKTVILTRFAYGLDIALDDFVIKGIRGIDLADIKLAQSLGYEVKLIGLTKKIGSGIFAEVGPALVPKHHPLASIRNEFNGVFVRSTGIGQSMYYGPGAGSLPTATSVVTDLAVIAENQSDNKPAPQFVSYQAKKAFADPNEVFYRYFIALELPDENVLWQEVQKLAAQFALSYEVVADQLIADKRRIVLLTEAINEVQKHQFVTNVNKMEMSNVSQIMKVMEE